MLEFSSSKQLTYMIERDVGDADMRILVASAGELKRAFLACTWTWMRNRKAWTLTCSRWYQASIRKTLRISFS